MLYKSLFISFAALIALTSCGPSEQEKAAQKEKQDSIAKIKAHTDYLDAVKKAEKDINDNRDKPFNSQLAVAALKAYNDFTVHFPDDSMTPEYLFRASDLAVATGNYRQAATFLEIIINKHHEYPRYADACFAAANVYDQYLEKVDNGGDRAKQLYQFIIDHYPNSSYADNAKVLISYIGKPDSVLFNDVIHKADSVSAAQAKKGKKVKGGK